MPRHERNQRVQNRTRPFATSLTFHALYATRRIDCALRLMPITATAPTTAPTTAPATAAPEKTASFHMPPLSSPFRLFLMPLLLFLLLVRVPAACSVAARLKWTINPITHRATLPPSQVCLVTTITFINITSIPILILTISTTTAAYIANTPRSRGPLCFSSRSNSSSSSRACSYVLHVAAPSGLE